MAQATDIPESIRRQVHERDAGCCRCCGIWAGSPHLHHIVYRSHERNRHTLENLVSLCWRCHKIAHAHPNEVRPALQAVIELGPGTTAAQWLRWHGVDLQALQRNLV
jgi:5-methylcytosine-specific restriction endonuclease McrA